MFSRKVQSRMDGCQNSPCWPPGSPTPAFSEIGMHTAVAQLAPRTALAWAIFSARALLDGKKVFFKSRHYQPSRGGSPPA